MTKPKILPSNGKDYEAACTPSGDRASFKPGMTRIQNLVAGRQYLRHQDPDRILLQDNQVPFKEILGKPSTTWRGNETHKIWKIDLSPEEPALEKKDVLFILCSILGTGFECTPTETAGKKCVEMLATFLLPALLKYEENPPKKTPPKKKAVKTQEIE